MDHELFSSMTMKEQRQAFYSKIYNPVTRKFTISLEDVKEWRRLLPMAVENEYDRLDAGQLPRMLTMKTVVKEASASSRPSTTSDETWCHPQDRHPPLTIRGRCAGGGLSSPRETSPRNPPEICVSMSPK
jgi:hypothetical protein